jgi:hypothetical protein
MECQGIMIVHATMKKDSSRPSLGERIPERESCYKEGNNQGQFNVTINNESGKFLR